MDALHRHAMHPAGRPATDDRNTGRIRRDAPHGGDSPLRPHAGHGTFRDLERRRFCPHKGCGRQQGDVGLDRRSGSVGIRSTAYPVRLSDGADDRLVFPQRRRRPGLRTSAGRALRTLHRGALHAAHRGDHSHYPGGWRRCRDGRHLQLAGDALAAKHRIFPCLHALCGIVLRSLRNHDALVDGQQGRRQGRHQRYGRHRWLSPCPSRFLRFSRRC